MFSLAGLRVISKPFLTDRLCLQEDGFAALQDFHKWRLTRLLHERIYTQVDTSLWEQALAQRPELLQGLYANQRHPEGVVVFSEEVRDYGQRARRSEELDCWVGTMADFTGRMP